MKARGYRGWVTLETHWRVVPLDALYVAATTRPTSPLAEQLPGGAKP